MGHPLSAGLAWIRVYWWWVLLCAVFLSGMAVPPLLETLTRHWTLTWLEQQGVQQARIDTIEYRPLKGEVRFGGIEISSPDKGRLSITEFRGDLSWRSLLDRKVRLEQLELEGAEIALVQDGTTWWLGGLKLPSENHPSKESSDTPSSDWQWRSDSVQVEGVRWKVATMAEGPIEGTLNRLEVGLLASDRPEQPTPTRVEIDWADGSFSWKGDIVPLAPVPQVQGTLHLNKLSLAYLSRFLPEDAETQLMGTLSSRFDIHLLIGEEKIEGKITGPITLDEITATLPGREARANRLLWEGALTLQNALNTTGSLDGTLSGESVELRAAEGESRIRLAQGTLGPNISFAGEQLEATFDLLLENLELLEGEKLFGQLTRLELQQAAVQSSSTQPPQIRFDKTVAKGLTLDLIRTKSGATNLEQFLARWVNDDPQNASDASENAPGQFALGQFVLEEGRVNWEDRSIEPASQVAINDVQLEVGELDTARPEQPTPYLFQAQHGEYGRIKAEGTVALMSQPTNLTIKADLKNLELLPLSSYIASGVGQGVKHGQANLEVKGGIDQGKVDVTTQLHLARLELAPLAEGESGLKTLSGMPLQQALNMLRDRDGDIRLEIPVQGDLSDPQFGLEGVLGTALQKGVQKAAFSYLAPLGIQLLTNVALPPGSLFIAGKLVELAATVRFDPVVFLPGATSWTPESASQLDALKKILKERPGIRLILVGYAGRNEWPVLMQQRGDPALAGLPPEKIAERLRGLAKDRAEAIKGYLVEQGVAPDRIFPAAPQLEESVAPPRVEIGA